MSAVTLRRLLAMGLLAEHRVLGGASGLDRPTRMVVPGASVAALTDLAPGSVVVLGPEQLVLDELAADLALRLAHSAGLAGIIAELPGRPVPLVTCRLADKLGLPLVGLRSVAPAQVAATFDPFVRAPEIAGLRLLGTTAQRFQTPPADPRQLTDILTRTLGGPVALVDAEGRLVSGADRVVTGPGIREHLDRPRAVPGTYAVPGEDTVLLAPVQLERAGPAHFWLAARLTALPSALLEPMRQALGVAALSFAVYVAGHTASLERESRRRALLLAEILDQAREPAGPAPWVVERAAALGWRLAGWHTAVHLTAADGSSPRRPGALAADLEDRLAAGGCPARLVERPDGWAFWTTADSHTTTRSRAALRSTVREALRGSESAYPGTTLCAGLGGVHGGAAGIARSLDEAWQACLLARSGRDAVVEHSDAVTRTRLLAGWYASGALRSVADEVLTPLRDGDPSGELMRTLRTYLDLESSTTATAAALGVHRNTVIQRVDRARRLLPLDLDDPDDRLLVHMATRADDTPTTDPA
jgi:PucR family transcriptional regulator, purine catabolism regulatory protein